jgi:hypothetical protein
VRRRSSGTPGTAYVRVSCVYMRSMQVDPTAAFQLGVNSGCRGTITEADRGVNTCSSLAVKKF